MINKGNKIFRFYPEINIKRVLIFVIIFLICPLPVILAGSFLEIIKDLYNALSYMLIMGTIVLLSSPFIMFIIYHLQSFTIYSNGIASFNPKNNKLEFMLWESMENIRYNSKVRNGYYVISSFDNNNQLWLPSYIKSRKKFIEVVSEHAGHNNIITEYFQNTIKNT